MKILAIETSCDETAAAVIGDLGNSSNPSPTPQILSNVVVSQIDVFAAYGGVIPEVAARSHLEAILPVIHKALNDAHCTKDDIDYLAVTYAPGLLGSLLIGTLTARTLAILWHKPLYAVHHLKSHIYANWLQDNNHGEQPQKQVKQGQKGSEHSFARHPEPGKARTSTENSVATDFSDAVQEKTALSLSATPEFPLLSLVISGGHTQIIYMPAHNQFEIIGTTRDDAVGECFDKIAKILGLPYPGGPSIATCAEQGDPNKYSLPHPKIDGLDFSFSGLKTAVLRAVQSACNLPITTPSHELADHLTKQQQSDFAASFQATACDILLEKLHTALQCHPDVKSIVFAGGVSANQALRAKAQTSFRDPNLKIFFPAPKFSGDNAAMVGAATYYEILTDVQPINPYQLNILPRTPIK